MSKTIDKLYCVRQKTESQQQIRPAAHARAVLPRAAQTRDRAARSARS